MKRSTGFRDHVSSPTFGESGRVGGLERPVVRAFPRAGVVGPDGPLLDPGPDELTCSAVRRSPLGGMASSGSSPDDPADQRALAGLARHDRRPLGAASEGPGPVVEPEVGLLLLGAVAGVASASKIGRTSLAKSTSWAPTSRAVKASKARRSKPEIARRSGGSGRVGASRPRSSTGRPGWAAGREVGGRAGTISP